MSSGCKKAPGDPAGRKRPNQRVSPGRHPPRYLSSVAQADAGSDARFGVSRLALAAVVRITTYSRPFNVPSTLEEAYHFCDYLINQPHCQTVGPGERHWELFRRLCIETNTRGKRVTDAWFAAFAIDWAASGSRSSGLCSISRIEVGSSKFPSLHKKLIGSMSIATFTEPRSFGALLQPVVQAVRRLRLRQEAGTVKANRFRGDLGY